MDNIQYSKTFNSQHRVLKIDELLHKSIIHNSMESAGETLHLPVIFFSSLEILVGQSLYSKLYNLFDAYMALANSNVNYLNAERDYTDIMSEYEVMLKNFYELEQKMKNSNTDLASGTYNPNLEEVVNDRNSWCNEMNNLAISMNQLLKEIEIIETSRKDASALVKLNASNIKKIYNTLITEAENKNVLKLKESAFRQDCLNHFLSAVMYNETSEFGEEEAYLFDTLYGLAIREVDCLVDCANNARTIVKTDPLREFNKKELEVIGRDFDNWNRIVSEYQTVVKGK